MKLIVISAAESITQEPKLLNQLFKAGMNYFHLRKPGKSEAEVSNLISQIDPCYHSKITLHQHHFLAGKNSIKRLHFTEEMRNKTERKDLQQLKRQGFTLSTSVHQAETISEMQHFDYVFLSPVFNSISKVGYIGFADASFTLQKSVKQPEVIALGGIDANNIQQLEKMNFDGAAILGALWQQPEQALVKFKELQKICYKNSIPTV